MNAFGQFTLISCMMLLFADGISALRASHQVHQVASNTRNNSNLKTSDLVNRIAFQLHHQARNERNDLSLDDTREELETVPLHMNKTELYELCKSYTQSNNTAVIDSLTGKVLSNSVTSDVRNDINSGLRRACLDMFTPKRVTKRETTTLIPLYKLSKVKEKLNTNKSSQIGKPVKAAGAPLITTSTDRVLIGGEPPDVFPNRTSAGSIVVNVTGHDPVQAPNPDTNAAENFPSNPQYDLSNITIFQKKITVLLEKINLIVENNNSRDHLNKSKAVISIMNELKANLDQWIYSNNQTLSHDHIHNKTNHGNQTLTIGLVESKFYLGTLAHQLLENGTGSLELLCKINSLYEEIKNLTNLDIEFNIDTDYFDPKTNCSHIDRVENCPPLDEGVTLHHAETDIEDLSFHPPMFAVLAICFAVVSILSYIGLISWRYILEKRYGTRQLLMNEDTEYYDSAPDIHPFEIRSEQL
ncbi:hypothetical protein WDU94_011436 [Cyamophila willieti]